MEDDVVADEGLVFIIYIYNENPTPLFRHAEAITMIGIRKQFGQYEND